MTIACALVTTGDLFIMDANAQEINGELVLHVPFDDETYDSSQWYMVQRNDNTAEILGMLEDGPEEGSAMVILTTTFPDIGLNDIQYTNETVTPPEGSGEFPWRVTFWARVKTAPFTIRPIVAMSADPWTGTSTEYTVETAGEWHFVDITLDAEPNLTTDPLLLIFHMGNPGDEYDENELWLDELKLYLLNQEPVFVLDWMIMN